MATYLYQGRTVRGTLERGEVEAASVAAARAQLVRRRIRPIMIKPKRAGFTIPLIGGRVSQKEVAVFTRQFATMIEAGLPLVQCLSILGKQQTNKEFERILKDVKESVEGGSTLSDALKRHPRVFNDLYVNLVAAGEVAGILDNILNRLATYMEKALKLKGQVKSAMIYPAAIMTVAVGVVAVLLIVVIPVFAKMFADFGAKLPPLTLFVIALSYILKNNILYIGGFLVALAVAFMQIRRTRGGRLMIDKAFLGLPIFGPLFRKIAVARFSRTLGTMVQSGVAILDALEICAKTAGNIIIEEALLRARASIAQGKTIAEPLEESGVFPPMVVQMVAVGEATGNLDAMLAKIADFYDEEVDVAVKGLTSLLEPVMIVFMGVIIGFLVISMYMPIFTMATAIGG